MKIRSCFALVGLATAWLGASRLAAAPASDFWKASGTQGVVAAGGAEAADAAIRILKSGGNAADAAVASLLCLAVTDPGNFCFGGEVPIIVYDAKRNLVEIICGQGGRPRLATREYFVRHHGGRIPGSDDPTTVAVPGAPDAMLTALDRYGTKTFGEVAQPVLEILEGVKDQARVRAQGGIRSFNPLPTASAKWRRLATVRGPELVPAVGQADPPHDRGREGLVGRPPPRTAPGRRLLLSRAHRPGPGCLEPQVRRTVALRRSGDPRDPDRGPHLDRVPRLHGAQVRPVESGAVDAPDASAVGEDRSGLHEAE